MLSRIIISAVALSFLAGTGALAQSTETDTVSAGAKPGQGAPVSIFGRLDRDGNGSVNLDEFGGERVEILRNADADGNGTLSQDELVTFLIDRDYQRRAERVALRLDIDGDGTVTLAEIEDHQGKRFALADRNNDGELSQEEMRRGAFATRMRHMDGKGRDRDGRRFVVRRGEGPRHIFKHREAPAMPGAPDKTPTQD